MRRPRQRGRLAIAGTALATAAAAALLVGERGAHDVQAVGRLIRTESDYGRVSILDTRLKTAAYGKKLLAALPAFRRIG